jgi:DNA-binding MarR family transcriptional regulator
MAALLTMDRTTLMAALKPLERRGLVVVEPDLQNRRARRLRLTDAGQAVLAASVPIGRHTPAAIEASLPGLDAAELRVSLWALACNGPFTSLSVRRLRHQRYGWAYSSIFLFKRLSFPCLNG